MEPGANRSLLLRTAAHVRGRLVLLVVLLAVRTAVGLATPALLAAAIGAALRNSGESRPLLLLGSAVVVGAVSEAGLAPVAAGVAGRGTAWVQTRVVEHVLALGSRATVSAGEAVARVAQGAAGTANLPLSVASSAASLAGSVVAFVALWAIDWWIGLTVTLTVPIALWVARTFMTGVTAAQARYLAAQSDLSTRLLAALGGARTVRAAGTVTVETARVLRPLPELSASGRAMWRLQRGVVWQFKLLLPLTQVLALAVAGLGVEAGRLGPAELLAVGGYLSIALGALDQIDVVLQLAQVKAGVTRIAEILAEPLPEDGTHRPPAGPGAVTFRAVAAAKGGEPVLDGLDLEIPAGTAVALVGRTGAGKSLVAALIGRLADPDHGTVLLDGVPVADLPPADLRRRVAYAFERPALVGATIHEAITYGRPELARGAAESAAATARAAAFIRRLPAGFDTPLSEAPMSGGERQRLGLARAVVRQAQVYVLDDATSGLDTVTEAEVSEAVTTLLTGRTRLVIAHRATTAARCDLVAWLDRGRIRAMAPHAELWTDPAYRAMFGAGPQEGPGPESGAGTGTGTEVGAGGGPTVPRPSAAGHPSAPEPAQHRPQEQAQEQAQVQAQEQAHA